MPDLTLRRSRASSPISLRPSAIVSAARATFFVLPELLERRLCLSATSFLPPVSYAANVPAAAVAAGDFNGDSNEDIALAGNAGIYLLTGKGDGTFDAATRISTDTGAVALYAEDVNGDGNTDLVAANPADGTLTILPGKGDGSFGDPATVAAVPGVSAVAFGNFNGNAGIDGGGGVSAVGVGVGAGIGGIVGGVAKATAVIASPLPVPDPKPVPDPVPVPLPAPVPTPAPTPPAGYTEDIVAAGTGGLAILSADADGTLTPVRIIHSGSYRGVAVDDFNQDGNDDLAATTGSQVQVFNGNGDGTFTAPAGYDLGSAGTTIVTGDFNGDYVDDLAVATPGANSVAVLTANTDADGNATGTFGPAASVAAGATPATIQAADVEGDGNTDLVAATPGGVVVLSGNGDGTFAGPASFGGAGAAGLALDDFNGDGYLDLASANATGGATVQLQSVPDVGVTTSAPASVAIHGVLTYTITVRNAGPSEATGVSLSDCLPTDATLVSAAASQGSVDTSAQSQVDVNLGTLADGASATVTVVVRPQNYGMVSSFATVSTESPDGNFDNNFAESDTQVVGTSGAELGITQSATGGERFLPIERPIATPIFRVTGRPVAVAAGGGAVSATGAVPAAGAVASTGPVSSTGAAVAAGGTVSSGGAVGSPIVEPIVPPDEPTLPIDPLPPIWWGGFIKVGDNVTYTLTVTNNGPETAAGVAVNDTLPQNVSLVSATASQGTADTSAAGSVKVALGDLAVGASATVTVVVKAGQVGTITNTAAVSSATADPFPDNNSSAVSRYVTDDTSPPYPEPLAGPIAYGAGGAVYAAGAGVALNTSGGATGSASGGGGSPTLVSLPAGAAARSDAPSQLNIRDVKVKEGKGGAKDAVFTVTRKGNRKGTASVHFSTADGTARAGADYVAAAGVLTFGPGVRKLRITVPVKPASGPGPDKLFTVNLSSATDASIAATSASGTIVNANKVSVKSGAVRVNFQPAGATAPAGFLADTGLAFGPRAGGLSYGWAADATSSAARRSGPAGQVGSTYNVLSAGDNWEVALPDGRYKVRIVASGKVDAEETPVVTGAATAARPFAQGTRTITVGDGRLTLGDGAGVADVKIASVDLTRLGGKGRGHGG